MERKISVFLAGSWGKLNLGDDVLLLTLRDILLEKGTIGKIYAFGKSGSYLDSLVPEIEWINPWRPYMLDIDLFIYGGGTQFFSFSQTRYQLVRTRLMKMLNLLIREPQFIFWKIVERIFRKKKFRIHLKKKMAVGLGLGPFHSKAESHKVADDLLKSCSYISVRDTFSYRLLLELGRKRQVNLKTDLCYLMDLPEKNNPPVEIKNLAFVVRDWKHGYNRDLAPELIKASKILRSEGYQVRFVLFRGKKDKVWHRRLKHLGEQPLLWEGDDVAAFLKQLSDFDLVVTSRYHGAVFSTLSGIPFIAIEIEPKLKLVSEEFPESAGLWKAPFQAAELLDDIQRCNDTYPALLDSLKKELETRKALANEMKEELMSRIN